MNRDTLKGKAKDIGGRIQRQAGEWAGREDQQVKGGLKQAEGKGQEMLGKVRDAGKDLQRDLEGRHDKDRDQNKNAA